MTPGTPLEPWSVYVIFGTWTYTDDKKLGILVITDTEGIIYPCESEGETWKTEKEWLRKYLAAFRIGGDTGRVFDYGTSEASEFVITLQALRKTDDASVKSDEQVLDIQLRNVWDSFPSCRASSLSALAMHALKSTAGVKRAAAMDDSSSDSAFAQRLSGCRNPFAHSNGVLSRLPPDNIQLVGPLVQEDVFGPKSTVFGISAVHVRACVLVTGEAIAIARRREREGRTGMITRLTGMHLVFYKVMHGV
ncbi:hypothetical protein DFH11DRAFT_1551528 [Phellopilus nigrolimitatus]|nr:hypothetical protein DFH11DRAFT_1551528 [Phellopilus nigrolimitatus]